MVHEFVQILDLLLENSFIPTILLGYIRETYSFSGAIQTFFYQHCVHVAYKLMKEI